jgi:ADP-ribose pyrophosphatase YjhB (NUDIX family)
LLLTQQPRTSTIIQARSAFPGGAVEAEDRTACDCFLRETEEEIGPSG